MKPEHVLVFGGTSDAVEICQALEACDVRYTLSVATPEGRHTAQCLNAPVIDGRLSERAMKEWITSHGVEMVIDAAHPYAQVLRQTILDACRPLECPVIRYERPSTIESIDHPLIHRVSDVAQACKKIRGDQKKVLLTTGSKDLRAFCCQLPDTTLYARVLPTSGVIAECEEAGLGIENIIAMKGPFSQAMNHALYQMLQPDVVITKESGQVGGFTEKVFPCIELGIECIVIERPMKAQINQYADYLTNVEECVALFSHWKQQEYIL
ncbi:precorrin-6A reductase [Vibrio albus]|uniref:Precorrin-6A reductase n=1 Tax=Vibrio albus TaxID=2200953 RepID=A0A2U3B636_9VIBR|nr:precorrin-6A reductase [Vibrio albus]PWI32247.1 precorrin-6A reductase [Vibrio albus]